MARRIWSRIVTTQPNYINVNELCRRQAVSLKNVIEAAGIPYHSGKEYLVRRRDERRLFEAIRAERKRRRDKGAIFWNRPIDPEWAPLLESVVYFIQCGDYLKIGVANNARARMEDLQVGCPHDLALIGELPGGETLETELHRRFQKFHHRGEWFRFEGALRTFCREELHEKLHGETTPPSEMQNSY
jgi:hypothetical protein